MSVVGAEASAEAMLYSRQLRGTPTLERVQLGAITLVLCNEQYSWAMRTLADLLPHAMSDVSRR